MGKFRDPNYLRAIANRNAIEASGIQLGDKVVYDSLERREYLFDGLATGGRVKLRNLDGSARKGTFNPQGILFNGKPLREKKEKV